MQKRRSFLRITSEQHPCGFVANGTMRQSRESAEMIPAKQGPSSINIELPCPIP
jgi:hypothetical protein